MIKLILSSVFTLLLFGCASSSTNSLTQLSHSTSGQVAGDATSIFWLTENLQRPISSSDYVMEGDYGWYKTSYRWEGDTLRELVREGEQLNIGNGLLPYSIHIRFNKEGEAVYQQFRNDGRVLPINKAQMSRYQTEAEQVVKVSRENKRLGKQIFQGYWNGETFESCSGEEYSSVDFNSQLSTFVLNRLKTIESYIAFNGSEQKGQLNIETLLVLADENYACIEPPALIK